MSTNSGQDHKGYEDINKAENNFIDEVEIESAKNYLENFSPRMLVR